MTDRPHSAIGRRVSLPNATTDGPATVWLVRPDGLTFASFADFLWRTGQPVPVPDPWEHVT